MAEQWLVSDRHGLFILARLVDDYWTTSDPALRAKAATEIRLQRQCFGLTPQDRRRLDWRTTSTPAPAARPPLGAVRAADDPRGKVI
jgi:hypothetical protein